MGSCLGPPPFEEPFGTLTSVPGKRAIFTKMVNAALEHPD